MSRRNRLSQVNQEANTEEPLPDVENDVETDVPIKDVSLSTIHGHDLKKIKSFKKLRQSYKISNQKSVFITDMKSMLAHLDVTENKLNLQFLVEVCNIANEFFIYGKSDMRETSKAEAVYELLLPYFGDNVHLLSAMLESVQYKIRHSTRLKRLYKRVYNFFCTIGKA